MAAEQNDFVQILNSLLSSDNAIRQVAEVSVQKKNENRKIHFVSILRCLLIKPHNLREKIYISSVQVFFFGV